MTGLSLRRRFAVLAVFCLAVQLTSARWIVRDFDTPNASTQIARELVATGGYSAQFGQRLWGPSAPQASVPLRYYVLPGEPLYLAAMFTVLPESLWRYVHVPVTVLLIASVVAFAAIVAGPRVATVTALVAILQPFMIVHGPVWDDTFLAASLQWFGLAALATALRKNRTLRPARVRWSTFVAALGIGIAAVTRGDVLAFVGGLVILATTARDIRPILRDVFLFAATAVLLLGVWGLRNRSAVGSMELGSSHDGITLWESNGPYTSAALPHGQVMMLSLDPVLMAPYWSDTRTMNEVEANHYFTRRAMEFVLRNPTTAIRTSARKVLYTLTSIRPEMPLGSSRNIIGLIANVLTCGLAALGFGALNREHASRQPRRMMLLIPLLAIGVVGIVIGPIGMRYRIALDGILWIYAGSGVIRVADMLREHTRCMPRKETLPST